MKITIEISRPHYHPGPDFNKPLTKKRDLSVPPHWVANERHGDLAIIMPPRDKELYEHTQPVHIHMPEYVEITVKGQKMKAKVKVSKGYDFEPKVHFDDIEAAELGINGGEEATL